MEEYIRYKTSSPAGDLISFLAGIKQLHTQTGKKGVVYQRLNMPGAGYSDSIHPFQNEEGAPICMPEVMFNMLRPLLCIQPYIKDYQIWTGEEVDFDFDLIRQERYTNQPRGSLNRWYSYVFPEMACDLSKPWIVTDSRRYRNVVINFTQRYRNHIITYYWLKPYEKQLIFAGLPNERDVFCNQWGLDIPLLKVDDFWQLARNIEDSIFFMGNQSMCFQLAEAMKIPRILETFPLMPNVIPIGEDAYDFYHQNAVEYYFHKLLNK